MPARVIRLRPSAEVMDPLPECCDSGRAPVQAGTYRRTPQMALSIILHVSRLRTITWTDDQHRMISSAGGRGAMAEEAGQ